MPLFLGNLTLSDFEIPAHIRFGGRQALAVHDLPGGARVVDVLGRRDSAVRWSGMLTGRDATDRARALDAMRVAGDAISLSWDVFSYIVIVEHLQLTYSNSWWIPYSVSCVVVDDAAQSLSVVQPSVSSAVSGDLLQAASLTDVTAALATVAAAGATIPGTQAYIAAGLAIASTRISLSQLLASADAMLPLAQGDITGLAAEAGVLAQLSAARGFVARAGDNLGSASL